MRGAVRPFGIAAAALFVGAACGGGEEDGTTTREVITEQDTETVEVQVPVTDTAVVERTVDIDTSVSVDTIDEPRVEETDPE